jgi:hypothetical protein
MMSGTATSTTANAHFHFLNLSLMAETKKPGPPFDGDRECITKTQFLKCKTTQIHRIFQPKTRFRNILQSLETRGCLIGCKTSSPRSPIITSTEPCAPSYWGPLSYLPYPKRRNSRRPGFPLCRQTDTFARSLAAVVTLAAWLPWNLQSVKRRAVSSMTLLQYGKFAPGLLAVVLGLSAASIACSYFGAEKAVRGTYAAA